IYRYVTYRDGTDDGTGGPRTEEGQCRAARPVAGRGAAAARLRDRQADRDALPRRAALQHRLALPAPLPAGEARLDHRAVGRKGGTAPPPLLPADPRRAHGARRA